jgi:hypothetical protein
MSASPEISSKVAKGIFLWIPIGLVVAALGYYIVKQMPEKLPAISQALGANDRRSEEGAASSENRSGQSGNFNMSAMAAELDRRSLQNGNGQIPFASRGSGPYISPVPPRELSGMDSLLKPDPQWERQFAALMTNYSALQKDPEQQREWQDKMRALLDQQWERQQAEQAKELEIVKKIEAEWESALNLRESNRDAMIESYIGDWMGWPDPLQWLQGMASDWDLSAVEERERFRELLKASR